ncbi:MAG: rhomboid family intramembrane serine protease [Gammaproteobacteria bacterium]
MREDDWTIVCESRRRWECHEQALVLNALGIPHMIADGPRNSALLLVPADHAAIAREQLRLYAAENRRTTPRAALTLHGLGLPGVMGYVLVLIGAFLVQGRVAFGVDWLEAGGLHGAAVRNGEWWRVLTALTLHADAGHLVANLFFGAFFGAFAGQFLGSGVAWATILLAAGAGNALDLLLLPSSHRAIGASTAVFTALGLIAALMWRAEARRTSTWARRYAPLIGAAVLLAYLGTGDAQTDAVAHLTGFIAGIVAGAAYDVRRPRWLQSLGVQVLAGFGTLALLAACWWLAVSSWQAGLA